MADLNNLLSRKSYIENRLLEVDKSIVELGERVGDINNRKKKWYEFFSSSVYDTFGEMFLIGVRFNEREMLKSVLRDINTEIILIDKGYKNET